ncbi:DinB family protein [Sinomicrobium weinanense]|uniref:DinB family protein n=1 Tax=Sinomicrobium weinanense TaxID=2842200 RepID=A0A926JWA5_9FLAO|nr:DinB family protein [Sinomicrobium weinanense]MBC9798509.1 DinB family protein [Sinomicrobium weinanense]MBU3122486.1 DinB family protein [Sinomicrobium weinanense]
MRIINKPLPEEYPDYICIYMDLLGEDGKILEHLEQNFSEIRDFIYRLPEEKLYYRYDTGKWTIKEILVHLIDDERIFAYRALRYARNDDTPLHGFEQNSYARYSEAGSRSLESIFSEYEAVRKATITLFENLPKTALDRGGRSASGLYWSVRALVYHIAGHELRHFNIIKERYL